MQLGYIRIAGNVAFIISFYLYQKFFKSYEFRTNTIIALTINMFSLFIDLW